MQGKTLPQSYQQIERIKYYLSTMKSNFSQYGHHVDGGNANKIPRHIRVLMTQLRFTMNPVTIMGDKDRRKQFTPCPDVSILKWSLSSDSLSKERGLLSNCSVNLINVENQTRLFTL